jgi:hypothetical protein
LLVDWGLNSGLCTCKEGIPLLELYLHSNNIQFGDGVLWTICSGWSQTTVLLISASQVARITGMSHGCPDELSNSFI